MFSKLFGRKRTTSQNLSSRNYLEDRNQMVSILNDYLNTAYKEWYDESKCPLKAGDVVIFDKYNINGGKNTWDCGATLHKTESLYPFDLEVIEVFGDKSLSYEKIDKFMNNYSCQQFLVNDYEISANALIREFRSFLTKNSNMFGLSTDNIYGFYFGVKYKPVESTVNIHRWTLNDKSFIKKGTDLYDKTAELWRYETDLYFENEKMRAASKALDAKRNEFYSTVKSI
jgi:hypothetical protein